MPNVCVMFKGGPLDGTFEFPKFDKKTIPQALENDPAQMQAWSWCSIAGDKVGQAAWGMSPAFVEELRMGGEAEKKVRGGGHKYVNTERTKKGGKVFIRATYVPPEAART